MSITNHAEDKKWFQHQQFESQFPKVLSSFPEFDAKHASLRRLTWSLITEKTQKILSEFSYFAMENLIYRSCVYRIKFPSQIGDLSKKEISLCLTASKIGFFTKSYPDHILFFFSVRLRTLESAAPMKLKIGNEIYISDEAFNFTGSLPSFSLSKFIQDDSKIESKEDLQGKKRAFDFEGELGDEELNLMMQRFRQFVPPCQTKRVRGGDKI